MSLEHALPQGDLSRVSGVPAVWFTIGLSSNIPSPFYEGAQLAILIHFQPNGDPVGALDTRPVHFGVDGE